MQLVGSAKYPFGCGHSKSGVGGVDLVDGVDGSLQFSSFSSHIGLSPQSTRSGWSHQLWPMSHNSCFPAESSKMQIFYYNTRK